VFPSLLLLHPERAKPIVMFRHRNDRTGTRARKTIWCPRHDVPWESDPEAGVDHTPYSPTGEYREIHVTRHRDPRSGKYWQASQDKAWISNTAAVIENIAKFWVLECRCDRAVTEHDDRLGALRMQ